MNTQPEQAMLIYLLVYLYVYIIFRRTDMYCIINTYVMMWHYINTYMQYSLSHLLINVLYEIQSI